MYVSQWLCLTYKNNRITNFHLIDKKIISNYLFNYLIISPMIIEKKVYILLYLLYLLICIDFVKY